ncbi:ester cyclase [Nonomuraea sp. SMC257]|uniref:Ester cyclase n=1 Tax=Nonomuraea montanisoli TaxID=2741721 RepID=A0A7Y6M1P8_9ACTN|nr:nuclear transport factor 2 family protein [Nonomuraea montanisoli]NUW31292.1 ester cyclase [Nonomuraea montanisoli]
MTDLEQNKQLVLSFLDLAFNGRQPHEAFSRHVHPDYVQHNPHAPDGAEASADFLAGFVGGFPDLSLDIRRVVAEGDLVVTHALMRLTPDDRGTAIADVVRIRDGRIAEHWDVAQELPEATASGNPMV